MLLLIYLMFPWLLVRSNILQSAPCTCFHGVPCIEPLLVVIYKWFECLTHVHLWSLPVNNDNKLCFLNFLLLQSWHVSTEVHEELVVDPILHLLPWPPEQVDDHLTPVHSLQITLKLHILHPSKLFLWLPLTQWHNSTPLLSEFPPRLQSQTASDAHAQL